MYVVQVHASNLIIRKTYTSQSYFFLNNSKDICNSVDRVKEVLAIDMEN